MNNKFNSNKQPIITENQEKSIINKYNAEVEEFIKEKVREYK